MQRIRVRLNLCKSMCAANMLICYPTNMITEGDESLVFNLLLRQQVVNDFDGGVWAVSAAIIDYGKCLRARAI